MLGRRDGLGYRGQRLMIALCMCMCIYGRLGSRGDWLLCLGFESLI